MPRACVIVLDAVGAGELPDAAEWGDEGSDTLGNVARAVGGLDLPNLEALGLGNIEPLEGCPPQPYASRGSGRSTARALQGQGHDRRPLGADGRRHADAAFPTYPTAFPDEVIDPS
jgi:phosphopentomutase